jgi:hypothetical protein
MKIIISVLLTTLAIACQAQEYKKKDFMPAITRSIGGAFQQFDGLNSRVSNLPQYEQLKDYSATLGLGWFKERNQFISNMGISIGSTMSGHRDEKSSTVRFINVNADIGYDVLKNDKVTLYPLAGLGFQKYQAIFYKDNSNVDFDDVLESPAVQNSIEPVKFKNGFFVYRAGFGVSLKSPKYPSSSIGLQAGYTGSFRKNEWRSNEDQVLDNSPQDRISQFFVSLVLTSKPWMMR